MKRVYVTKFVKRKTKSKLQKTLISYKCNHKLGFPIFEPENDVVCYKIKRFLQNPRIAICQRYTYKYMHIIHQKQLMNRQCKISINQWRKCRVPVKRLFPGSLRFARSGEFGANVVRRTEVEYITVVIIKLGFGPQLLLGLKGPFNVSVVHLFATLR